MFKSSYLSIHIFLLLDEQLDMQLEFPLPAQARLDQKKIYIARSCSARSKKILLLPGSDTSGQLGASQFQLYCVAISIFNTLRLLKILLIIFSVNIFIDL